MNGLNNLFWFGKKELTQDAVLMWIFKNYNESDLKDVARDLIGYFSLGRTLRTDEEIISLRGKLQYKGIDVAIEFYLKSKSDEGWYYLIIEDKTYSYLHSNQIKKYLESAFIEFDDDWHIKNRPNTRIKVIYFKMTSLNRFDEEEPFKESFEIFNECKNFKNSIFDPKNDVRILDLIHFYENIIFKYLNSSNNILKEYSNYINERYKTMLDGQGKNSPCDITKYFIGYPSVWDDSKDERTIELSFEFFGSLFSRIEKKQNTNCEFWWCQYNYYFLKYFPNDSKNQNLPIIEIRSRDFLYDENKNIVRIEVHLVTYTEWFDNLYKNNKEEYVNLKGKWTKFLKEKYNNSKIFDLFYYEASTEKNNQRQLGKIIYENEGKISYLELIEILNKILEVQKFIDDELSKL